VSILAKLKADEPQTSKQNILITGRSGSGKTTLAGTMQGRTLLLSVAGKEFGVETAQAMAKARGNRVDAIALSSLSDFVKVAQELKGDDTYDTVYVDSLSGLTFLAADDPEISQLIQAKKGGNPFAGYSRIQAEMDKVHKAYCELLYAPTKKPKNVIFTLAIEPKLDASGLPAEISPIMAGKAAYSLFTRPAPTILVLATQQTETGPKRVLVTASTGPYVARLNGVLDETNPKTCEPDLSKLFDLISKETN
jgi:energy-coupling factor transporter ATP-binding protein EcfA2